MIKRFKKSKFLIIKC